MNHDETRCKVTTKMTGPPCRHKHNFCSHVLGGSVPTRVVGQQLIYVIINVVRDYFDSSFVMSLANHSSPTIG